MCDPFVVLDRDHSLDLLSLQSGVSGAQKWLQVGIRKDAKLDSLALNYYESSATSSSPTGSRRRRKRRTLAYPFNSTKKRKKRTMFSSYCQHDIGKTTIHHQPVLNDIPKGGGSENPIKVPQRSALMLAAGIVHDVSNEHSSLGIGRSQTDTTEKVTCEYHVPTSKEGMLNTANLEEATALCCTLGEENVQTVDASNHKGGAQADTSNRPSHSNDSLSQASLTKEDFMALLCLSPSHLISRIRTCNRHRASKYLIIKSRNVWRKICKEDEISPAESCVRPSYVLLERNDIIDCLARQPIPLSVNLGSFKYYFKSVTPRKQAIRWWWGNPLSLGVVLKRDPALDQLALLPERCTSSNVPNDCIASTEGKLESTGPTISQPINLASEESCCRNVCVKINRDSNIDLLAIQAADEVCFSSTIDKLTLAKSNKASSCHCQSPSASSSQPTVDLPLKDIRTGVPSSTPLPTVREVLSESNLGVHSHSAAPVSRVAAIKLRRIFPHDWSIIQLNEPNRSGNQPNNSVDTTTETTASDEESLGSENVKRDLGGYTCLSRPAPSSDAGRHCCESRHLDPCSQKRLVQTNQQSSTTLSPEEPLLPVWSLEKKNSEEMPATFSSASLTSSSRRRRRIKSLPCVEPVRVDLHPNENVNPHKQDVSPTKTVDVGKPTPDDAVLKSRVTRQNSKKVLHSEPLEHRQSNSKVTSRLCDNANLLQTSIPCYMPARKKPLSVKSGFYSTSNFNQL